MQKRLLILHCLAGAGHRAAAEAIAEAASRRGVTAGVVDALAHTPPLFARGYVETHLRATEHAPWAYGFGYARLDRRHPVADGLRRTVDRALGAALVRFAARVRADAIIATHFFPLSVLGGARLRGELAVPLIGVVTDYTAHAFWAEPGVDRYCVARGSAGYQLTRHGVPPADLVETGIPVGAAFSRAQFAGGPYRCTPPALEPAGGPMRVLVTSGGFGVGPIEATLASFKGRSDLAITVVCGNNPARVERVTRISRALGLRCEVIGFERDMAARLAACDVLVGKPGGLTVSEALAAGRPMVLVGACPGQEQHNEAWLELNGAAMSAAPARAGMQIDWLRRNPAELARMAAAARALSAPHAADAVLDVALATMGARNLLKPAA